MSAQGMKRNAYILLIILLFTVSIGAAK